MNSILLQTEFWCWNTARWMVGMRVLIRENVMCKMPVRFSFWNVNNSYFHTPKAKVNNTSFRFSNENISGGDLVLQGQTGEALSRKNCEEWDSPGKIQRWQLSTDKNGVRVWPNTFTGTCDESRSRSHVHWSFTLLLIITVSYHLKSCLVQCRLTFMPKTFHIFISLLVVAACNRTPKNQTACLILWYLTLSVLCVTHWQFNQCCYYLMHLLHWCLHIQSINQSILFVR